MIQTWLAKNAVKLGIIGVVITMIFGAGYYVKGKIDSAKILRLRNQVSVLQANYDNSLEQLETSIKNEKTLLEDLEKQNAAIIAANEAYVAKERSLRALYSRLMKEEGSRYSQIIEEHIRASEALKLRISAMSQSEACHEAWVSLLEE